MKFKLLLCTLLAASAAAFGSPLDIQPNPAAPGGLGAATNEFTSIYGHSMFATSITSSNVDASVIIFGDGSQQTTAANPLSFGASSSIGWSFIAGTNSAYVLPYIFDDYNAALNATNKLASLVVATNDTRSLTLTNTANRFSGQTFTAMSGGGFFGDGSGLTNLSGSGGSSLWTSSGGEVYPNGATGGDTVWTNNGSTIYPL